MYTEPWLFPVAKSGPSWVLMQVSGLSQTWDESSGPVKKSGLSGTGNK
jgi:hypothetical protein